MPETPLLVLTCGTRPGLLIDGMIASGYYI